MSRRHHGRPHHPARHHGLPGRPAAGAEPPRPTVADAPAPASAGASTGGPSTNGAHQGSPDPATAPSPVEAVAAAPIPPARTDGSPARADGAPGSTNGRAADDGRLNGGPRGFTGADHGHGERSAGCTAPQLRRFIKSRPYVPMHELRRRFAIDGGDDEVTQVRLDDSAIYVGLPAREGFLLGELLRGGEIGYELSLDPRSPIVVGVYPMRPVPRS
jgi:hypothetical protein